MKYNLSKILESINKGVNFALDDFEDEDLVGQLTQTVKDENHISDTITIEIIKNSLAKIQDLHRFYLKLFKLEPIDLDYLYSIGIDDDLDASLLLKYIEEKYTYNQEYIDFDLPSGTLWCVNNLGDINQENDYTGANYQWGTTEVITGTNNHSYPINDNYKDILTSDKLVQGHLALEDDPAYTQNKHHRVPTVEQFKELVENTDHLDLLECYAFISKENPLKFIIFSNRNELYMTSNISNKDSNPMANGKILGNGKAQIYFIKLFSYGNFEFKVIPFKSFTSGCFPPVTAHIRPIYIKK